MKALVTFCKGPMSEVYELTKDRLEYYAKRWGYDFVAPGCGGLGVEGFDPTEWSVDDRDKHPSWGKIDLVKKALKKWDTVLWMDADIMVADGRKDILDDVKDDTELAYVLHHTPFVDWMKHPNAGMFVVRNPQILEDVERLGRATTHERALRAWDQPGFLAVLGIDLDWRFKKRAKDDQTDPPWNPPVPYKFQELGHEWNYTRVDSRPHPNPLRFAHYCGMSNKHRMEGICSRRIGSLDYRVI